MQESKAAFDLHERLRQLAELMLTGRAVDETKGDWSRPASHAKNDFDMTSYQVRLHTYLGVYINVNSSRRYCMSSSLHADRLDRRRRELCPPKKR